MMLASGIETDRKVLVRIIEKTKNGYTVVVMSGAHKDRKTFVSKNNIEKIKVSFKMDILRINSINYGSLIMTMKNNDSNTMYDAMDEIYELLSDEMKDITCVECDGNFLVEFDFDAIQSEIKETLRDLKKEIKEILK